MPGPISDGYDPEYGTAENAQEIKQALQHLSGRLSQRLGPARYILDVVRGKPGKVQEMLFSEQELRILRFALNQTIETF